jgi:hypothetical protein
MVEAYLGAIFVDSKFDFQVIEAFFERQIKPFFEDMSIYDTFANKHPTVRGLIVFVFIQMADGILDFPLQQADERVRLYKLLLESRGIANH